MEELSAEGKATLKGNFANSGGGIHVPSRTFDHKSMGQNPYDG